MKWQPFVPKARANIQAIIDEESGTSVDVILAAGFRSGKDVKLGQVFATHPGHHEYEMRHFLFDHVVVRELEYDEETPSWLYEIMADPERSNYISARFSKVKDNIAIIELEAVNCSSVPADWIVSLFASPNAFCKNLKISDAKIETEAGHFSFAFDAEWYNTPPLAGRTDLCGMLLDWGVKPPEGRLYMNHFCEWRVNPGERSTRLVAVGILDDDYSPEKIAVSLCSSEDILPFDDMRSMIRHMENQVRLNRSYPPAKYQGKPFPAFTPAASWDDEYFWDAGFIAAALSVFAPERSEECISQYLPLSENTLFPDFCGAKVLIQVAAAWELYQQTGNKDSLRRLYPGLHEIFTYAAGVRPWPSGENLDEIGDGLLSTIGAGTGIDDAPSQVWSRGYGVAWARQNHYWCKPFDVNPTGKLIRTASVNMTAFAILSAKLLKQICFVLDVDVPSIYDSYISRAENSLQKVSWHENSGHYHWTVKATGEQCPYYDISGLTPLFSDSCGTDARREILIRNLIDIYLTPYGLTTVDRDVPWYRNGYWCGAVWLPFHWFFWKAFLGLGRIDEAEKVAMNILNNYASNYKEFPVCYEKFDSETGAGCGDFSFSGLGSIMLNLWAGYRKSGSVTTGFFNVILEKNIAADFSSLALKLLSHEKTSCTGILAVLRPDSIYHVVAGSFSTTLQSDKYGCLRISLPLPENEETLVDIKLK